MSLVRRKIDVTFQLGSGSFGDSGADTLKVTGLRIHAEISKAGGVSMSELQLNVYGLTLDQLNKLSILGKPITDVRRNIVTLEAGDDESGMAVVFTGIITESWPVMASAPDAYLAISAHTGLIDAMRPVPASSFSGPTDVVTVLSGLATQMGYSFVNSGVQGITLDSPYFPGTARDQAYAAAAHAGINITIDDGAPSKSPTAPGAPGGTPEAASGVLAVWPQGGSRGGAAVKLSATTGMIGYPTCTPNGIVVESLFNRSIAFGGLIDVESTLTVANGQWQVFKVTHILDAEMYEGHWMTRVEGSVLGHAIPIA